MKIRNCLNKTIRIILRKQFFFIFITIYGNTETINSIGFDFFNGKRKRIFFVTKFIGKILQWTSFAGRKSFHYKKRLIELIFLLN